MKINPAVKKKFQKEVWNFYKHHRRDLPWRRTHNPYEVFVSEVMLQQTQVTRVVPKYASFLKRFPNFSVLARASSREVLEEWQGMGYNRRALALKKAAEVVVKRHKGKLPRTIEELSLLPGIGKATAGAILAYAFEIPVPFIETNIRRTFIYFFFPRARKVKDENIMEVIGARIDKRRPREWYYAVVDFGAWLGKSRENPNRKSAHYRKQPPFKGSLRELRGAIVKALLDKKEISLSILVRSLPAPKTKIEDAVEALLREGFLIKKGGKIRMV